MRIQVRIPCQKSAQDNEDKKLEDSGSEEEEEENESEEDDAKVLRSGKRVTFS
jgi:hypothetical protein